MKKYTLIIIISISSMMAYGQDYGDYGPKGSSRSTGSTNWMNNFYVGGGIGGLQFSQNQVLVNVSGLVGYRFTEKLTTGVGLTYQYFKYKPTNTSYNDYGFNVFAQYTVYEPFFIMAQYEITSLDYPEGRRNSNAFLLGPGFSQKIGKKGFINFYALYNLTYDEDDSFDRYDSPWVIGMTAGIGF